MSMIESDRDIVLLVYKDKNGNIRQLGMSESQIRLLQIFASELSKEEKFVIMPEEYDLDLKNKTGLLLTT